MNIKMGFTELLEGFRGLGGVADNITLAYGQFGRGVFPINQNRPITIKVPAHLLVSPSCLYLDREHHVRVNKKSGLEPNFISFYEDYQQFFGWSSFSLDELSAHDKALRGLSENIKQFLLLFGWLKSDFVEKNINEHLHNYFVSRQIGINSASKLMPILELINHSASGKPYIVDDGVYVAGVFETEVLTCYRRNFDAFHFFRNYHFATETNTILSCNVKIEVPNIGIINISRFDSTFDIKEGVTRSKIIKSKAEVSISFLELVSDGNKTLPKTMFADRMHEFHISTQTANEIFDGLVDHNRKVLADMMDTCRLSDSGMAKELTAIAIKQFKLLQ